MSNGEDLPPAWTTEVDGGIVTDDVCPECDTVMMVSDDTRCADCQNKRYFSMG